MMNQVKRRLEYLVNWTKENPRTACRNYGLTGMGGAYFLLETPHWEYTGVGIMFVSLILVILSLRNGFWE